VIESDAEDGSPNRVRRVVGSRQSTGYVLYDEALIGWALGWRLILHVRVV
jgi:hypothetical protein